MTLLSVSKFKTCMHIVSLSGGLTVASHSHKKRKEFINKHYSCLKELRLIKYPFSCFHVPGNISYFEETLQFHSFIM